MRIFRLGYYGYDFANYQIFAHESKTDGEFHVDCETAMRESLPALLKGDDDIDFSNWLVAAGKKLEEHGYQKVVPYTLSFDEDDFRRSRSEHEPIVQIIGEDLYDNLLRHNFMHFITVHQRVYTCDNIVFILGDDLTCHRSNCPVLLKSWKQRIDWIKVDWVKDGRWLPCPVCKPDENEEIEPVQEADTA